ncbi:succinylglutamate desuccinylase/aspartoacylase family protein [Patescibacteria group bacterium]|nr:succinylglutamate desuccinylase/aspartoacylase family protein [Patescibacteria group bacterium]
MINDVNKLTGKEPGQTSIILVGVHGNEQCGVEALKKLLPTLSISRGTVLFILGNPKALGANARYIEANLNRMFNSSEAALVKYKHTYEYKRAQYLKKYLNESDVLLDIHASSIQNSRVFAICEPNAKEIVKYLPTDTVVSGFDDVEPGGTDYYMNSIGKVGICFECGYMNDSKSIQMAEEAILSFLKARRHLDEPVKAKDQQYIKMYYKYFSKTKDFVLDKPFENFESVKEGQIIGNDGIQEIVTPKDSYILFAHNSKNIGEEVFLLGGQRESLE